MKIPFASLLLFSLLLSGCGSKTSEDSSLFDFFTSENASSQAETPVPEELPYSEGPQSIPAELIPHDAPEAL